MESARKCPSFSARYIRHLSEHLYVRSVDEYLLNDFVFGLLAA